VETDRNLEFEAANGGSCVTSVDVLYPPSVHKSGLDTVERPEAGKPPGTMPAGTQPATTAQDYTTESVPLHDRRHPVTMGLLWITMVTGFPSVLVGFDWFKQGLSLNQVIGCSLVSCLLLMLYCLPSCLLGARSGLTYALLSRKVFGQWGSCFVSLNLVWVCIAWYGLTAVFLADGLNGLYSGNPLSPLVFSVVLAVLMAFNNFFGFNGVANFARYLAGPMLVVWVLFTFYKAAGTCPAAVWQVPSHVSAPQALTLVSSFVIGYSVWGNEADYWRFGKPSRSHIMLPLLAAVLLGELLFPVTGWLLAYMTGITDYAGATGLMNSYAFGGFSIIAASVLIISYVAVNDSSLYGAINALQNIAPIKTSLPYRAAAWLQPWPLPAASPPACSVGGQKVSRKSLHCPAWFCLAPQ
jgi:purine-cytosine permease-like protein